jgi:hypothetical protein
VPTLEVCQPGYLEPHNSPVITIVSISKFALPILIVKVRIAVNAFKWYGLIIKGC